MDQSPVNSKSKPSTKNVLIDTPYIPIFECRTGPSNMFDYPTPPPRPPKPRSYSGSTTPPAVNRDLKPRRKGSDSDSNSPASPTLKLSPPPSQSHYHVPVSRPQSVKLRIDAPPVPCRTRQSANNRDFFNVNNDIVNFSIISRRNLSHDEQSLRSNSVPRRSCDANSVTYLDLDLGSEFKSSNSDHLNKDLTSSVPKLHSDQGNQSLSVNSSQSTVYKKIDFIATDALRKLQIVHRNS